MAGRPKRRARLEREARKARAERTARAKVRRQKKAEWPEGGRWGYHQPLPKEYKVYSWNDLELSGMTMKELRRLSRDRDVAIIPDDFGHWVLAALLRGDAYLDHPVMDELWKASAGQPIADLLGERRLVMRRAPRKESDIVSVRDWVREADSAVDWYDT